MMTRRVQDGYLEIWIFVIMALKSPDGQHYVERRVEVGYLDIGLFVTIALKSQDDQHDDKGK